ncbi:MAG: hypothetical protein KKD55_02605 [Candidatus Omnitrophica bacterium]|nr:hypothetical protein [Candidatus Omnitrophota bacterium]MBU0897498.1 hypothetical protein [Candidatus Omnitrophota bacterium]
MNNEELMKKELKEGFNRLGQAVEMLKYSLQRCQKIGIKIEYSLEELDRFESLTSRFARTSDIYTQKIMKGITMLLREEANTFIDRANLFEKLEISNAEDLKLIRDLRNEISHEYKVDDITEIFEAVTKYSDKLMEIIERTKKFVEKLYRVGVGDIQKLATGGRDSRC